MDARILVLLSLIVGSLAGPISFKIQNLDRDTCARHCKDTKNFFYRPGTTYEFDYNVDSRTTVDGAFEDNARLRVRATADISVISPCEFSLSLRNVQLFESDPNNPTNLINADNSGEFRRALERHTLRFAFHDGAIEDVCITNDEPKWVLNIKRGVLSAFQNRMEDLQSNQRLHEKDVTGACEAEYTKGASSWRSITIEKKKNLLGCTDRHGYRSALHGAHYRVPSEIQSLPLLKSTHTSEQEISKKGLLQSATVTEMHVFRPFANGPNGAMTETTQKLRFTKESNNVKRPEPIQRRSDLLYEHENGNSQEDRQNEIRKVLNSMCSTNGVHMETPGQFADLVYMMKEADENSMREIYKDISRKSICKENPKQIRKGNVNKGFEILKFFMDALPMVGTRSALALMRDFLISKEVHGREADMWLTSLAFIQNPTRDMLTELKPLLRLSGTAMLSVSSLINNFCQKQNCENDHDIADIVRSITDREIGSGCIVKDNNLEKILVSLRSLGNIGYISTALNTINNCITRKDNPMQVRVSAVESLRRIPYSYPTDNKVIEIFTNKNEDSELRIAAYLAMMRSPNNDIINTVRQTMEQEEVNQLGSFVWSHLTNLMETSSPHMQSIKMILNDERLKKEFDMDNRKFSRNYEGSFFFERFNTGAKIDSNLIWSSKSFIPRSAMVNLTADLFGHSVNFLEIGGRIEGLEYLLESYFGPNGYFGEDSRPPYNKKAISNLQDSKLNKMDKEFNAKKEELRGAAYLRVFGNELRYKNINGLKSIFDPQSVNFIDILLKLSKDQEYTFSQSEMFMDSSMIIPTSAGLPLNLTVNGTATVEIDVAGKLNVRNLFTVARTMDIDGHIRPSGAVQIASLMSVDAFFTKTGLKMTTTLNTNTLVKGHIKLTNGQVLSAQFDMPEKKAEIFGIRTTYFTLHNKAEREQKMITENMQSQKICTGEQIADATGLELCAELKYPNASMKHDAPYFPLTGPLCFGITLDKKDTHTGYKLMAKAMKEKNDYVVDFHFDTPQSTRKSRSVGFATTLKPKERSMEVSMHSPWKTVNFGGFFNYTQALKRVYGKMTVDKDVVYDINAEMRTTRNKAYTRYNSKFEMNIPEQKKISLIHSLVLKGKKIETELTATGVPYGPWSVKGTASNTQNEKGILGSVTYENNKEYYLEMRLLQNQSKKRKVSFSYQPVFEIRIPDAKQKKGRILVSAGGSMKYVKDNSLNFDFSIQKLTKVPISFKGVLKQSYYAKRNRRHYNGRLDIQTPLLKVTTYGKVDNRNYKNVIYKLTTDYNAPGIKRNKIVLYGKWLNKSSVQKGILKALKLNWNSIMTMSNFPQYNTDVNVKMNYNKRYSELISAVKYGDKPKQSISLTVKSKHSFKKSGDNANIDAQLVHSNKNVNIQIKGSHKYDGENLNSRIKIQYAKDKAIAGSILHTKNEKKKARATSVTVEYPGGVVDMKNTLTRNGNQYRDKLNILLPKLGRTKMDGTLTISDKKEYLLDGNVYISKIKPINVDGNLKLDKEDFRSGVVIKYGKDHYGMKSNMKMVPRKSVTGDVHVITPWRQLKTNLNGIKKANQFTADASLLWDAAVNKSKKIAVSINLVHAGLQKINATLNVNYPSRTVQLKIQNSLKPKLQTHCELSWSPTEKAVLDMSLSDKDAKRHRVIDGNLQLKSPFTNLNGEFNLKNSDKEYSNLLKFFWAKDMAIVNKISLKKPYSLHNLRGIWKTTTPFKRLEKLQIEVDHHLEDQLHSSAKISVNKNEVALGIDGEVGNKAGRDYTGQIEFKSTFRPIRGIQLKAQHKDDGKLFKNNMALKWNGKNYGYDLAMKHNLTGWSLHNTGEIKTRIPSQIYKTEWQHLNKEDQLHMTFTHGARKKNWIDFTLHGDHAFDKTRRISGSMIMKTPLESFSNINMKMDHEISSNSIDSSTIIKNNGRKIVYIDGKLAKSNKGLDADLTFYTPLTNDKFNVKLDTNVRYNKYPMTCHGGLQWGKGKSASIDASVNRDHKQLEGSIRFTSPLDFARSLLLEVNNKYNKQECATSVRFERQPGNSHAEITSLELRRSLNNLRFIDATLATPYSKLELVKINYNIKGKLSKMTGYASVEVKPYFDNIKVNAAWNTENEISGSLSLITPFEALPKFSMSGNVEKNERGHSLNARVEYYPSKEIILTALGNIKNRGNVNGEIELRTPFKPVEYIKATLNHQGSPRKFNTNVGMKLNQHRNTDVAISLNAYEGLQAIITSNSPFFKNVHAEINYQTSNEELTGNSRISYGRKNLLNTKLKVVYTPNYSGEFELQTDVTENIENMKVLFQHEGTSVSDFKSSLELSYGRSKAAIKMNRKNNIDASLVITTPYEIIRQFDASLNHEGNSQSFNNRVSFIYNGQELQSNIMASLRKPLTLEVNVQTPWEIARHIHLSLNHEGEITNFKTHVEYAVNYRNAIGDIEFRLKPQVSGKISISTPYSIGNINAEFSHNGPIQKFNNYASVNIDGKEIRVDTNFRSQPDIDTKINIRTPFESVRNIIASYKHKGILEDFSCHGEVIINNRKYEGDLVSKTKGEIDTRIDIRTPTDTKSLALHFSGNKENFDFSSELDLTKVMGKIVLTKNDAITFNMNGKMDSQRQMKLDFTHRGTQDNFETNLNGDINGSGFGGDIKFIKKTSGVTAVANLHTPLEALRSMQIDLSHRATASDVRTQLNSDLNGERFLATVQFTNTSNGFTFTSNMETPFVFLHNMKIDLKHHWDSDKLENILNMDMNGNSIAGELTINKIDESVVFTLNTNTDCEAFKHMLVKLNHRGRLNEFETSFIATLDDYISSDVTLENKARRFILNTNLKTQTDSLKNVHLSIKNTRGTSQYSSMITTNLDTSLLQGDATLKTSYDRHDDNKQSINLKTNFENMKNIQFDFTKSGRRDNFETKFSGYLAQKRIDGNVVFKTSSDNINFEATINTPFEDFQTMHLDLSHKRHLTGCETTVNTNFNDQNFVECNVNIGEDMLVSLQIRGKQHEPIHLKFDKKGNLRDFQTKGSVEYGDQVGSFDLSFAMSPTIKGNMILNLPVKNFTRTAASFDLSLEERAMKFESKLQYSNTKEIQLTASYDANNGLSGSFTLQSPYCSDIHISWKQSGSRNNFRVAMQGTYGVIKYSGEAAFKNEDGLSGELTLNSLDIPVIHMQFNAQGPINQCTANFEMNIIDFKVEGDIKVHFPEEINGKVASSSPFGNYEFEYTHHLSSNEMDCHAEATIEDKKYEADLVLRKQQQIEASLTVKTPISGYEETALSFRTEGSWRNFNNDISLSYRNENAKLTTQFTLTDEILNTQLSLATPFECLKSFHVRTQNSLNEHAVNSHVVVTYNTDVKYESTFDIDWASEIELKVEVHTPFEKYEQSILNVKMNKDVNNFKANMNVEMLQKQMAAQITFNNNNNNRAGSLTLKTPIEGYENINIKFSNQRSRNTVKCTAQIDVNDAEMLLFEFDHKGFPKSFENTLIFRSPYMEPLKFRIIHNVLSGRFTTIAEVDFGKVTNLRNDLSVLLSKDNININNKFTSDIAGEKTTVQGIIKHRRIAKTFNSQLLASYNDKIIEINDEWSTADGIHGKLEVSTPFPQLISSNINVRQERGRNYLSMTLKGKEHEVSANIDSPYETPLRNINFEFDFSNLTDSQNNMRARWNHNLAQNRWSIDGNAVYRGESIVLTSKGQLTPSLDASVSLTTPFSGYEETSLSAKFENDKNILKAESSVYYGSHKSITFRTFANWNTSPIQFTLHTTSPFSGWETVNFNAEYFGHSHDHESSLKFQRSNMQTVSLTTKLAYSSPLAMDGSVELITGIPDYEKLSLQIRNEEMGNKYTSYIEAGWNDHDKIVFEGLCEPTKTYDKQTLKSELKLRTPFEKLQSIAVKIDHDLGTEEKSGKVYAEYNGRDIVDIYGQYTKRSTHNVMLVLRQPHPMRLQMNGVISRRLIDGDIMLDWDSNNPDSNIRIETKIKNDRQIVMKLVKSGRIMGLEGSIRRTKYSMESSGKLILNENSGRIIGYEAQSIIRGNTNRKDLKIMTPWRSMSIDNTVEMRPKQNNINGQFNWNTEQPDKRVGWKLEVNRANPEMKYALELQLPSIGKDIKLETDFTVLSGRTIFDGSTEVTYSKYADSFRIFSRVMDISQQGQNYSFTFGIKHPATAVDLEVSGTAGKSDEKYTGSMNVNYMTALKRIQNIALIGEIDRVRKKLNFELHSPIKTLQFTGKVNTEAPYQISYKAVQDNSRVSRGMASYNPNTQSISMNTHYDPSNTKKVLEWNAKLGSRKIESEISVFDGREKTIESLIALTLNTSHILHSRIEWNPHMIDELKEYGNYIIHRNGQKIGRLTKLVAEGLTSEVQYRFDLISRHLYEELKPILDDLQELISELEQFEKGLVKAYNQNKYYLKDMVEERLLEKPLILYHKLKKNLQLVELASEILTDGRHTISNMIRSQMEDAEINMQKAIKELTVNTSKKYENAMNWLQNEYQQWVIRTREGYNRIRKIVQNIEEKLNENPSAINIKKHVNNMINKMSVKEIIPEQYTGMIYNASQVMSDRLNVAMNRKGLRNVRDVSNMIYQQSKWAWNYWRVKENMVELVNDFAEEIQNIINQEIRTLKKTILFDMNRSRVIAFNPENGQVQFELYSPLPVMSLNYLPRIDLRSKMNAVKSLIPDMSQFSVWDIYYKYIPPRTFRELLPPFRAIAAISDNSHFFTFDGQHFDFAGRCSYVLVRDMLHNNFTVIANYNRRSTIDSIQVLTTENVIEIRNNGRIRVNNKRVELPNKVGNTKIERAGQVIRLVEGNNFVLDYDMAHDYYFISINGWYHGRLAGLLGYFDNEPFNDLMMSNGVVTDDVAQFASSWEVASRCGTTKNYADYEEQSSIENRGKCERFFRKNNSTFRPCFKQVEPREFMHICEKEMSRGGHFLCKTAAIYVHMCREKRVHIRLPEQCVRCHNPDGKDFQEGENITLTTSRPQQADVLFVLESHACNKKTFKKLDNLAKDISEQMKKEGIVDTKFGLMGYDKYHVHMHTVNGDIFTDAKTFNPESEELNDTPRGDSMKALKKAAEYPSRTGSKRIVILVPCGKCEKSSVQYKDVHQLFKDQDISLHLLTPLTLDLKKTTSSPKTNYIFGLDDKKAYSVIHKQGNQELLNQLQIPKDQCISLATETDGSAFDKVKLNQGRQNSQKEFSDVFVKRISKSSKASPCQTCRCTRDEHGVGVTVCHKCNINAKKNEIDVPEMKEFNEYLNMDTKYA